MKQLIKYTLLISMGLFVLPSCEDEDEIRVPSFEEGVNARAIVTVEKSFLDFTNLEDASYAFEYTSANPEDIERAVIYATFIDFNDTINFPAPGKDSVYAEFEIASLTGSEFPMDFEWTSEFLASQVGFSVLPDPANPTQLSFSGGDFYNFRFEITDTQGRVWDVDDANPSITGNSGGTISLEDPFKSKTFGSSFTTTLFTFVGCPTEIVPGDYIMEPTNGVGNWCSNSPFAGAVLVDEKEVTISQTGIVFFEISDVTLEYYVNLGPNLNADQGLIILDVCNQILLSELTTAQFNGIDITGLHDPSTNSMEIQWVDRVNSNITCENTLTLKED